MAYKKDASEAHFTVEQTQVSKERKVPLFHVNVEVEVVDEAGAVFVGVVRFDDGGDLSSSSLSSSSLSSSSSSSNKAMTTVKLAGSAPAQVRFDPHGKLLCTLDFNPGEPMLLEVARRGGDVVSRIRAYYELIKIGSPTAMDGVCEHIASEPYYGVRVKGRHVDPAGEGVGWGGVWRVGGRGPRRQHQTHSVLVLFFAILCYPMLSSPILSSTIRYAVAAKLSEVKTAAALKILCEMLKSETHPWALWRLAKCCSVRDAGVREAILFVLKRGHEGGHEGGNPGLPYRAHEFLLENLGGQAHADDLRMLLTVAKDDGRRGQHDYVRCGAYRGLGNHRSMDAFAHLLSVVRGGSGPDANNANGNGQETVSALVGAIDGLARATLWLDDHPQQQQSGGGKCKREQVTELLTAIATRDEEGMLGGGGWWGWGMGKVALSLIMHSSLDHSITPDYIIPRRCIRTDKEPARKAALAGLIRLGACRTADTIHQSKVLYAAQDGVWLEEQVSKLRRSGGGGGGGDGSSSSGDVLKRMEEMEAKIRKLEEQLHETLARDSATTENNAGDKTKPPPTVTSSTATSTSPSV